MNISEPDNFDEGDMNMEWQAQPTKAEPRNPIEGALGKYMALIVGVVGLVAGQSHLDAWVVIVLWSILAVGALMILWSPFAAFTKWVKNAIHRRRLRSNYLGGLKRLSSALERILNVNHSTS